MRLDAFLSLFLTVAKTESNYNVYALRFEPHFMNRIRRNTPNWVKERKAQLRDYMSDETFLMLASCSYGVIQILGYNLIEFMVKTKRWNEVLDTEDLLKALWDLHLHVLYFKSFLNENLFNLANLVDALEHHEINRELERFAKLWNGSKVYARLLVRNFKERDFYEEATFLYRYGEEIFDAVREVL